jgi:hypothetical protein
MSIDAEEAALIKGMLVRGDKQQWIVAWFGGEYNSGRIADIHTGKTWPEVRPAKESELPPPGPYAAPATLLALKRRLRAIEEAIDEALQEIGRLG